MHALTLDHPTLTTPAHDCALCPRLSAGREAAPAAPKGPASARLLVVGMAPHPTDALLIPTLHRLGLADQAEPDGATLHDIRLTHAVRCPPPHHLPDPAEVRTCNQYLAAELATLPNLRAVLAHAAVLKACGIPPTRIRFSHGAIHDLPDGLILADCDHAAPPERQEATILALLKRLEDEA